MRAYVQVKYLFPHAANSNPTTRHYYFRFFSFLFAFFLYIFFIVLLVLVCVSVACCCFFFFFLPVFTLRVISVSGIFAMAVFLVNNSRLHEVFTRYMVLFLHVLVAAIIVVVRACSF